MEQVYREVCGEKEALLKSERQQKNDLLKAKQKQDMHLRNKIRTLNDLLEEQRIEAQKVHDADLQRIEELKQIKVKLEQRVVRLESEL